MPALAGQKDEGWRQFSGESVPIRRGTAFGAAMLTGRDAIGELVRVRLLLVLVAYAFRSVAVETTHSSPEFALTTLQSLHSRENTTFALPP